jgi:predicted transcriptional regulator
MDQKEAMQAAVEIVRAQASARPMTEDEIVSMIGNVAHGIRVAAGTMPVPEAEATSPDIDPKKAVKENSVVCLECGKSFKVLTKKHLATHGLTPEEYRAKYGYRKGQALCAKSLVRERRKKMKGMKLWERRTKKPATEVQQ